MQKILLWATLLVNPFNHINGIDKLLELQHQNASPSKDMHDPIEMSCHHRCRGEKGPEGPPGPQGPAGTALKAYGALQLTPTSCSDPITFTGAGGLIPGNTTTNFTIINVPAIPITTLSITLNNLLHTYSNDLSGFITLPDTTVIPLFFRMDGSNDYNGVYTFIDNFYSLNAASTLNPIPSGSYFATDLTLLHNPVNINALANGRSAAGTWTLTMQDLVLADSGSLGSWSFTLNCPPSPSVPLNATFGLIPLTTGGNEFFNMTSNGSTIEIGIPGDYQILYTISGTTNLITSNIEAIVGINGDTTNNPTFTKSVINNSSFTSFNSFNKSILHLNAGDSIGLYLRSTQPTNMINTTISLQAVLLKADQ